MASVANWNPHSSSADSLVAGWQNDVLVFSPSSSDSPVVALRNAHGRSVSDASWSCHEYHVLASCSPDTFVNVWDVRVPGPTRKVIQFCAWTSAASIVRWNHFRSHELASAHAGQVRVWDTRNPTRYVSLIDTHSASTDVLSHHGNDLDLSGGSGNGTMSSRSIICSMDYSFSNENELLTCSANSSVIRLWDVSDPDAASIPLRSGHSAIQSARFTPFGRAILTNTSLVSAPSAASSSSKAKSSIMSLGTLTAAGSTSTEGLRLWRLDETSARPKLASVQLYNTNAVDASSMSVVATPSFGFRAFDFRVLRNDTVQIVASMAETPALAVFSVDPIHIEICGGDRSDEYSADRTRAGDRSDVEADFVSSRLDAQQMRQQRLETELELVASQVTGITILSVRRVCSNSFGVSQI